MHVASQAPLVTGGLCAVIMLLDVPSRLMVCHQKFVSRRDRHDCKQSGIVLHPFQTFFGKRHYMDVARMPFPHLCPVAKIHRRAAMIQAIL